MRECVWVFRDLRQSVVWVRFLGSLGEFGVGFGVGEGLIVEWVLGDLLGFYRILSESAEIRTL